MTVALAPTLPEAVPAEARFFGRGAGTAGVPACLGDEAVLDPKSGEAIPECDVACWADAISSGLASRLSISSKSKLLSDGPTPTGAGVSSFDSRVVGSGGRTHPLGGTTLIIVPHLGHAKS